MQGSVSEQKLPALDSRRSTTRNNNLVDVEERMQVEKYNDENDFKSWMKQQDNLGNGH